MDCNCPSCDKAREYTRGLAHGWLGGTATVVLTYLLMHLFFSR